MRPSWVLRPVARGGGGRWGSDDPPPVAHPKDFVPPFSNVVPPFSNLFHPLAILFHPLAILFHPLAILFHPWNMWMTSHGQCPRGGACECPRGGCFPIFRRADDVTRTMSKGGACECPRVGAFFKLMTSRGQCPKGAGVRLVFHPSKFRPPPHMAGWLRAWCWIYWTTGATVNLL